MKVTAQPLVCIPAPSPSLPSETNTVPRDARPRRRRPPLSITQRAVLRRRTITQRQKLQLPNKNVVLCTPNRTSPLDAGQVATAELPQSLR